MIFKSTRSLTLGRKIAFMLLKCKSFFKSCLPHHSLPESQHHPSSQRNSIVPTPRGTLLCLSAAIFLMPSQISFPSAITTATKKLSHPLLSMPPFSDYYLPSSVLHCNPPHNQPHPPAFQPPNNSSPSPSLKFQLLAGFLVFFDQFSVAVHKYFRTKQRKRTKQ